MLSDTIEYTKMNQTGFFDTRNDFNVYLRFFFGSANELKAVLGFAHSTRGNGANLGIVRCCNFLHPHQTCNTSVDRVSGKFVHVAGAMSDAHRLFFGLDYFKPTLNHFGDHEMK